MEEQIIRIMQGLKCSREEAEEIYKADKEIDKGETMDFDLTAEQLKVARQYAKTADRKKPIKVDRKKTENTAKKDLVTLLAEALKDTADTLNITNAEREILFTIGEDNYQINLIAKRKPKN